MSEEQILETEDIQKDTLDRKALIERAKAVDESKSWDEIKEEVKDIQRKWKNIPRWDSIGEQEEQEQFDAVMDKFYAKEREIKKAGVEAKQAIIDEIQKLITDKDFGGNATTKVKESINSWKEVGHTADDKKLWDSYQQVKDSFFEARRENFKTLQSKYEQAKAVKQDLIEQAKALSNSTDWTKTTNAYKEMMDKWKEVGSAGKEFEDSLWNDFTAARQVFFGARKEYYDQLHKEQAQHFAAKRELLDQAKDILASGEFTKENTALMKELSVKWKEVGSCGKEKDDRVWKPFRETMDSYFESLKEINEEKHQNWLSHMNDLRDRKANLIESQKRQLERLKRDQSEAIGQSTVDALQEDIADKEEFIAKLETELADLDKSISE